MVLSNVDTKRYIAMAYIQIAPDLPEQYGSCSVDCRPGSKCSVFEQPRKKYAGHSRPRASRFGTEVSK
jgi:deoxycytidine triphosphate deaminase